MLVAVILLHACSAQQGDGGVAVASTPLHSIVFVTSVREVMMCCSRGLHGRRAGIMN